MENYSAWYLNNCSSCKSKVKIKYGPVPLCQKIPEKKEDFLKWQLSLRSWKTGKGKSWHLKSS